MAQPPVFINRRLNVEGILSYLREELSPLGWKVEWNDIVWGAGFLLQSPLGVDVFWHPTSGIVRDDYSIIYHGETGSPMGIGRFLKIVRKPSFQVDLALRMLSNRFWWFLSGSGRFFQDSHILREALSRYDPTFADPGLVEERKIAKKLFLGETITDEEGRKLYSWINSKNAFIEVVDTRVFWCSLLLSKTRI